MDRDRCIICFLPVLFQNCIASRDGRLVNRRVGPLFHRAELEGRGSSGGNTLPIGAPTPPDKRSQQEVRPEQERLARYRGEEGLKERRGAGTRRVFLGEERDIPQVCQFLRDEPPNAVKTGFVPNATADHETAERPRREEPKGQHHPASRIHNRLGVTGRNGASPTPRPVAG